MTAKLKQRQRGTISALGARICDPQRRGTPASAPSPGSIQRCEASCGGNLPRRCEAKAGAQRRHRLRPHPTLQSPRAQPHPHHSSFVITPVPAPAPTSRSNLPRFLPAHKSLTISSVKLSQTQSNRVKPCILGWRQLVATTFPLARRPNHNENVCYPIRHSPFVILPSVLSVSLWPKTCISPVLRVRRSALRLKDESNPVQPSPTQSSPVKPSQTMCIGMATACRHNIPLPPPKIVISENTSREPADS